MAYILVVEDSVFIRELTEMTLRDWGHQTFSATDVEEALAVLHSPQRLDVLFTDVRLKMAEYGGCELALKAIALRPKLRVLYSSGILLPLDISEKFVAGAECLRKPYTSDQMRDSLDRLLAV